MKPTWHKKKKEHGGISKKNNLIFQVYKMYAKKLFLFRPPVYLRVTCGSWDTFSETPTKQNLSETTGMI